MGLKLRKVLQSFGLIERKMPLRKVPHGMRRQDPNISKFKFRSLLVSKWFASFSRNKQKIDSHWVFFLCTFDHHLVGCQGIMFWRLENANAMPYVVYDH